MGWEENEEPPDKQARKGAAAPLVGLVSPVPFFGLRHILQRRNQKLSEVKRSQLWWKDTGGLRLRSLQDPQKKILRLLTGL